MATGMPLFSGVTLQPVTTTSLPAGWKRSAITINAMQQQQMIHKLRSMRQLVPTEVGRALLIETELEATECRRRVPVDTGALKGTITALGPYRDNDKVFTLVVAGGPAAPYALVVHEDLEAFHAVGEAKYIERPLFESAPYIAQRVARTIELVRMIAA
jgi:hypothetical protein